MLGFKDRYQLNEWKLMGTGDILLLYTDGLLEHARGGKPYFPHPGGQTAPAWQIFDEIKSHLLSFADLSDHASIVIIKRT